MSFVREFKTMYTFRSRTVEHSVKMSNLPAHGVTTYNYEMK